MLQSCMPLCRCTGDGLGRGTAGGGHQDGDSRSKGRHAQGRTPLAITTLQSISCFCPFIPAESCSSVTPVVGAAAAGYLIGRMLDRIGGSSIAPHHPPTSFGAEGRAGAGRSGAGVWAVRLGRIRERRLRQAQAHDAAGQRRGGEEGT
jgi:hypothetical protein